MLSFIRAGFAAALLAFAPLAAGAAEKSFQDQRLADSAVTLEAQIKGDAGKPAKPLAQIRRELARIIGVDRTRAGARGRRRADGDDC